MGTVIIFPRQRPRRHRLWPTALVVFGVVAVAGYVAVDRSPPEPTVEASALVGLAPIGPAFAQIAALARHEGRTLSHQTYLRAMRLAAAECRALSDISADRHDACNLAFRGEVGL